MGRLFSKPWTAIIFTWLFIFTLHNAQYIFANLLFSEEGYHFTPFAYKAPFGLSEDNLAYAKMIRHAAEDPTLFVTDGIIKENKGINSPIGNIVIVYLGFIQNLLGDINLTYYFGGFIPLLLSVILIFKIIQIFFQEDAIPIAAGISVIILCSDFSDFVGLEKFINAVFFPNEYQGDVLVLGYAQRFVYSQSSLFLFLFWIYRLFKFNSNANIKNQLLLGLSLTFLVYAYFYFWSFAIAFTITVVVFKRLKFKQFIYLFSAFILLTFSYWLKFTEFLFTDSYNDFNQNMRGNEYYPLVGIIFLGTTSILPFIQEGKKLINLSIFLGPILMGYTIDLITYNLQPFHPIYKAFQFIIPAVLIGLILLARFVNKWNFKGLFCLLNYYIIFGLVSLNFIIGFNIQPYHWVYATFYPVLIFALLLSWKNFINIKLVGITALSIVALGLFNSFQSAKHNGKFWRISDNDLEVAEFLNQQNKPVIAGNNLMPLITMAAHSDIYIYEGMTCINKSTFSESASRFIEPYKRMGYSDSLIIEEFNKHRKIEDYHQIFISNDVAKRDSLSKVYPDNILGTLETMFHYFTNPEPHLPKFKEALSNHSSPDFELDLLVIYKSTIPKSLPLPKNSIVFENGNYLIISAR